MAKAKGGAGDGKNKSEAIREVIAQNPKAGTKDVIAQLASKGIKVAPTLVYYIKSKQNQQKRKQKRERVAASSRTTPARNPVELVARVKALAREVGGIRPLKQLVDLLAE
jgi:ABC-type Fe3+ transport system substrate-binding protein